MTYRVIYAENNREADPEAGKSFTNPFSALSWIRNSVPGISLLRRLGGLGKRNDKRIPLKHVNRIKFVSCIMRFKQKTAKNSSATNRLETRETHTEEGINDEKLMEGNEI